MNYNPLDDQSQQNQNHNFPQPNRAGDLVNYNVLCARPIINSTSPHLVNSHLQTLLQINDGQQFFMTINVSNQGSETIKYYLTDNYVHPITQRILDAQLPQGFTKVDSKPGGIALDYQREKLVDFNQMILLKEDAQNSQNNLRQLLTKQLTDAFQTADSLMFVFGSMFDNGKEYSPYGVSEGIHDIHMNQGSVGAHAPSNGIYQDGALLIFYPSQNRWSAGFFCFRSQNTNTDNSGN